MPDSKSPPHVRLYRYLKAEYAIAAIRRRELRVSRLKELNDPFEFTVAITPIHSSWPSAILDKKLAFLVDEFHPKWGVISFSEQIYDPVVWSHYSDSHRGIALGFDYTLNDTLLKIKYPPKRPTVEVDRLSSMSEAEQKALFRQIISTKAPSWGYEAEQRVFVTLSECERRNGHYFREIPDDFLKHVVLGMRCDVQEDEVRKILRKSGFEDVIVSRARRSPTNYQVLH